MTRARLWIVVGGIAAVLVGFLLFQAREPDYSEVQVPKAADLERELENLRERLDIPGMSAVIAIKERIVWARGFGRWSSKSHVNR